VIPAEVSTGRGLGMPLLDRAPIEPRRRPMADDHGPSIKDDEQYEARRRSAPIDGLGG
jgi:hypothetical protein